MSDLDLFDALEHALAAAEAEEGEEGLSPDEAVREVFREEAAELLADAERRLATPMGHWDVEEVVRHAHRLFHTLTGAARTAVYPRYAEVCREVELAFLEVREGRMAPTSSLAAAANEAIALLRSAGPLTLEPSSVECIRRRLAGP